LNSRVFTVFHWLFSYYFASNEIMLYFISFQMTILLLLLFTLLRLGTTLPDLDDNMVPTEEDIIRALLQRVTSLNLINFNYIKKN